MNHEWNKFTVLSFLCFVYKFVLKFVLRLLLLRRKCDWSGEFNFNFIRFNLSGILADFFGFAFPLTICFIFTYFLINVKISNYLDYLRHCVKMIQHKKSSTI